MREKAERQRVELEQRREHYKALHPADVDAVPWSQAREINCLSGGSGGVLLVDLGDECVALKPQGQTAASELLAQHLAQHCGVRVAQCRVVRHSEPEHKDILNIHDHLDCPVVGSEKAAVSKLFRRHVRSDGSLGGRGAQLFGVLEYVPGTPLMGVEAQRVVEAADDTLWLSMGRLCALDVLLNNMDRLPLPVWDNDGNLGNIMLPATTSEEGLVGIDQQVNVILPGPGRERYLQKVRQLVVAAAAPDSIMPSQVLQSMHQAMTVNCGVELTEERARLVLEGLVLGFQAVERSWRDGDLQASFEKASAVCRERLSDDSAVWDQVYSENDMYWMVEFVSCVAGCITSALQHLSK